MPDELKGDNTTFSNKFNIGHTYDCPSTIKWGHTYDRVLLNEDMFSGNLEKS